MVWRIEEIQRDWLLGDQIAVSPEEIVQAFERVEALLGPEWVQSRRVQTSGAGPTLEVVIVGRKLAALDGVVGAEKLIQGLRKGDVSASAELTALYLVRPPERRTEAEAYPEIQVGSRSRVPDFRVRERPDEPWAYVEATRTNLSDAQSRATAVLRRLAAPVSSVKREFTLEMFLLREPDEHELDQLVADVPGFCQGEGFKKQLVGDLAILVLNAAPPNVVTPYNHPEDDHRPRLGLARAIVGGQEPSRHISVRMPYSDERAKRFLIEEAQQLPTDSPGFIMIDMAGAPGGMKSWAPLLLRCLQPTQHTRVGGIGLFMEGVMPTESGLEWLVETSVLVNPHAKLPVPHWIPESVKQAGERFGRLRAGKTIPGGSVNPISAS